MKGIFRLMLLCAVMLVGCSHYDDVYKPGFAGNSGNSYTVNVDMGIEELDAKYGTSSTLSLTFFEYNDKNEMVNYKTWYNVKDNATKKLSAYKLATKIIAYIEMDSYIPQTGQTVEFNRYVAQVFYLENNMEIIIDGSTRVSEYHPLR